MFIGIFFQMSLNVVAHVLLLAFAKCFFQILLKPFRFWHCLARLILLTLSLVTNTDNTFS